MSQQGGELSDYHPVLVEGMGAYDQRDPLEVAQQVCRQLTRHWIHQPPSKPLILLTQGDPLSAKGISAITPRVAEHFDIPAASFISMSTSQIIIGAMQTALTCLLPYPTQ